MLHIRKFFLDKTELKTVSNVVLHECIRQVGNVCMEKRK